MSQTRNNLTQLSGQLVLNNEETEITAKIERKEPSIIGLLLLIFVTLSVYSLGIDQLNNGVNIFVDTAMEKLSSIDYVTFSMSNPF